eukprot:m.2942 g.2942  ORF g.2942 m.2942 type:complete len:201 (+) comp1888_c0_seq1:181-783(+)
MSANTHPSIAPGPWQLLGEAVSESLDLPAPQTTADLENVLQRLFGNQTGLSEDVDSRLLDRLVDHCLTQEDIDGGRTACAICLNSLSADENVLLLECTHIFHRACLQPWLSQQTTCPVCRHDLLHGTSSSETAGSGNTLAVARMLASYVSGDSRLGLPADSSFNCTVNPFATPHTVNATVNTPTTSTNTAHSLTDTIPLD